jgi:protein-S-isoprenylcysteine O-methyltransferase Ste14
MGDVIKMNSNPKILPPTGMLIAVLLILALHFLFPITPFMPGFWQLLGLFPLVLGLAISYAAENQFRRVDTTVQPFDESSRLVTDGLYRFSRNPMYLGMTLVLFGIAILMGSLVPLVVVAFFIGWIQICFVRKEEAMMLTQFGQDWLEYKSSVRRWF